MLFCNFVDNPILNDLEPKDKAKVLEKLSTDIPVELTTHLIDDENYWMRCCCSRWEVCDIELYGGSWKRCFFERYFKDLLENFVPNQSDISVIFKTFALGSKYIKRLNISQLLPPVRYNENNLVELSDTDSDNQSIDVPDYDHFDFCQLLPFLHHLEEFRVVYGVKNCGMNFEWSIFKFTKRDCFQLSVFLKKCEQLKKITIQESKVDDFKTRVISKHLLDHSCLQILNLSHNHIGNRGARAIAKLINNRLVKLKCYQYQQYGSEWLVVKFFFFANFIVQTPAVDFLL